MSRETQGFSDISALPPLRLWNFKSSNPRVSSEVEILEKRHLIDPSTGYPARPVVSVTIFAGKTASADANTTEVLMVTPDKGLELVEKNPGLEGIVVFKKESASDSILDWKVSKGIAEENKIVNYEKGFYEKNISYRGSRVFRVAYL